MTPVARPGRGRDLAAWVRFGHRRRQPLAHQRHSAVHQPGDGGAGRALLDHGRGDAGELRRGQLGGGEVQVAGQRLSMRRSRVGEVRHRNLRDDVQQDVLDVRPVPVDRRAADSRAIRNPLVRDRRPALCVRRSGSE
jgi:hypothetical protein